jgi:pimeloyl-ACP methyl ester carboxylesterase
MPFTTIDGVRLETRTIPGAADKPWLVFLHEGLGCVSLWRDFPEKLARRLDMPARLYSRRGYGRSDPLDGPHQPDFMHREALEVLPALLAAHGVPKSLLIGHSDGASIALIHAAHHPQSVAGAVLMAPHVFVEPVSQTSIARITETYERTDLRARLARHHAHVDDAFLGWSRIWLDPRFRTWSLASECRHLTPLTLLVQGEDDEYGTLAQLDAIEQAAPTKPQRLVLPRCGHSPHRDREADVIEAIAAFTASLLRGA